MKYMKKPIIIDATQWFANGDHPGDYDRDADREQAIEDDWEGMIVRYYSHPEHDSGKFCNHCDKIMKVHGWIDTLEGGHIVCPGDFIITGVQGEHYPCKPDIFKATYYDQG